MKTRKRYVSALLAAVLALTCAGCATSPDASGGGSASTGASEPAGVDANFQPTGYPIVKEPITLDIVISKNDGTEDLATNPALMEVYEKTNINVDWTYTGADWNDKKALLLASANLPDVFCYGLNDSDIINNSDLFVPMEDYIDQYCPNIQNMFQEDPAMKSVLTAPDGHIYTLVNKQALQYKLVKGASINVKWLEKAGLAIPTTTDELYTALKAFKTMDMNGNGKNDEIPLSFIGLEYLTPLFGSFGCAIDRDFLSVTDGKVEYGPVMDSFREAVKYFAKLGTEGLLDPEGFTQDWSMYGAKIDDKDNLRTGIYMGGPVTGPTWEQYQTLPPLKGPDGTQSYVYDPSVGVLRNVFTVTSSNKNVEATMRFADALYDPEVSLQMCFGVYGQNLIKNDDGTITMTEAPEGMVKAVWWWKNAYRNRGPLWVPDELAGKVIPNSLIVGRLNDDKMYEPFYKAGYPLVYMTKAQSEELSLLKADINKCMQETIADMITNGYSDEAWATYLDQMDNMGLERFVEIYQQAYDVYMNG